MRLVAGGRIALMLLVMEVTEQVMMRRQLETERKRLRTVLETLPRGSGRSRALHA